MMNGGELQWVSARSARERIIQSCLHRMLIRFTAILHEKELKIAMWGDYLLESVRDTLVQDRVSSTGMKYQTPGAVRPEIVKESIPKDILIFNWFWDDLEKEMDLYKFGFTQIYGNFTPAISNWDERIKKVDMTGGAPSAWASTNEFTFGKDLVLDYLGCANLLWSTHTLESAGPGRDSQGYDACCKSRIQGYTEFPVEDGDPVVPVDISQTDEPGSRYQGIWS